MGTHRPQLECRRTTPPLRSISATAQVARLLVDKATRCKAVARPHQHLPRRVHPFAARLAGLRVRPCQLPQCARLASISRPTESFMLWAGAVPTQPAATSRTHLNIIRRLTLGRPRQLPTPTTRSTTWLAGCSLTRGLPTSTALAGKQRERLSLRVGCSVTTLSPTRSARLLLPGRKAQS